jgi:hypothetical protein
MQVVQLALDVADTAPEGVEPRSLLVLLGPYLAQESEHHVVWFLGHPPTPPPPA